MRFMRARELSTPVPDRTPSTHTASADEGGNESRGGTEVNYQIDVRPQSTLCPPSPPSCPPKPTPDCSTQSSWSVAANRKLWTVYATRLKPDDFFPTARRLSKARSVNITVVTMG